MKILKKDGLKYIDQGHGQVVLFFHGWGLSPRSYKIIIDRLALEYRVIVPLISSFKDFKKEEDRIMSIFNNKTSLIVIGHSAGGTLAANFSVDFPDLIKGLVLIDSVGAIKNNSNFKNAFKWFKHGLGIITHPSAINAVLIKDFLTNILNPIKLLKEAMFSLTKHLEFNPKFPVLILWGKTDDLISIDDGFALQKLIPGSKFVTEEGNHYWFLNQPEILIKEIKNFIN